MRTKTYLHQEIENKKSHYQGVYPVNYLMDRLLLVILVILTVFWSESSAETEGSDSVKDFVTLNNLSRFIEDLENRHPVLESSKAELKAAKARTKAASKPLYNPELELDTERIGFHGTNVDTLTIGISQTIDWYDKRTARASIAQAELQVNQYESEALFQSLLGEVLTTLSSYQTQQHVVAIQRERLKLIDEILQQGLRLFKAGDISKLDLEQLRLAQSQIQLLKDQAETQLALIQRELETVYGSPRENWPEFPDKLPVLTIDALDYQKILTELPRYKVAVSQLSIADRRVQLRRLEKKADPKIGVRAGTEESDTLIGITLSIPLNVRNDFQAEVDEAEEILKATQYLSENSEYKLLLMIKTAAASYQMNYSIWKKWQRHSSASLQAQENLLLRLWKAGELSTTDYLLQLNQIKEIQLNSVELKGRAWRAWFNWLVTSNRFKDWVNSITVKGTS